MNTKNVCFLVATAATTVIFKYCMHGTEVVRIDTRKTYTKITCLLLLFSLVKSSISVTTQELFLGDEDSPVPKVVARTGGAWVNFCWVCAAGLLESLLHYSLLWPNINPILVTFGEM